MVEYLMGFILGIVIGMFGCWNLFIRDFKRIRK